MQTIKKYRIFLSSGDKISMPLDSEILDIKEEDGRISMWCLVEQKLEIGMRQIVIFNSGEPLDGKQERKYIGTAIIDEMDLHFFDGGYVPIFEMKDLKNGCKVHYTNISGVTENGIVKSASMLETVFVVYNCDGDWEGYENYTASRTHFRDLKPGWVNDARNAKH